MSAPCSRSKETISLLPEPAAHISGVVRPCAQATKSAKHESLAIRATHGHTVLEPVPRRALLSPRRSTYSIEPVGAGARIQQLLDLGQIAPLGRGSQRTARLPRTGGISSHCLRRPDLGVSKSHGAIAWLGANISPHLACGCNPADPSPASLPTSAVGLEQSCSRLWPSLRPGSREWVRRHQRELASCIQEPMVSTQPRGNHHSVQGMLASERSRSYAHYKQLGSHGTLYAWLEHAGGCKDHQA